jgi:raffinose/stachyose/melibiose transport system substrate-binding protein
MIDSRINRRKALQLGVATGLTLLPGTRRAAAQETPIKFWNSTFPTVDPNDKAKKLEDFYVYKAVARFQEANPGITVAIENLQGGTDQFTKYRTSSVAKNGPDVMGMWSGS